MILNKIGIKSHEKKIFVIAYYDGCFNRYIY